MSEEKTGENIKNNKKENAAGQGKKEASEGRSKGARIMAIIALAILFGLLVWLVVCLITGSKYTMAVLFCVIVYPILLYIGLWLKKVFSS